MAGTATAVSNRVSRRQVGRWAAQEQQYEPQQQYAPPPQQQYAPQQVQQPMPAQPAEPSGGDMDAKIAQLKELAALRDQGVINSYEFETQKRAILGP
ncbi:SHOCT domain-containing protein [Georgenia ruanii]|uniref:SHOCT domain-containing protein n=1 Tax=Georgenia ruanii TaxID=348442 RepID=A0A7J9URL2_9MICO|nr:SHOCT domain-containing protein [Georgenia ruanii]